MDTHTSLCADPFVTGLTIPVHISATRVSFLEHRTGLALQIPAGVFQQPWDQGLQTPRDAAQGPLQPGTADALLPRPSPLPNMLHVPGP